MAIIQEPSLDIERQQFMRLVNKINNIRDLNQKIKEIQIATNRINTINSINLNPNKAFSYKQVLDNLLEKLTLEIEYIKLQSEKMRADRILSNLATELAAIT